MKLRPAPLMALLFAALTFTPAAQAQKPDYDRLKNILEDKFKPDAPAKPSSESPKRKPAPSGTGSDDFEYVTPDANALKKKRSGGKAEGWLDSLKKKVWGKSSSLAGFATPATAGPLSGAAPADTLSEIIPVGGGASDQGVPVAKKNSYLIQLKPEVTEQQIQDLLKKYDLKITKVIGALGVITVEQNNPVEVAPSMEGAAPQQKLELILDPPLVQSLRSEPAVDAAFVDSLIGTKGLPKPSGAEIKIGDKAYAWRWQPGDIPDGNWGLKAIRMPAMWSLIERNRAVNPGAPRPRIGIIDVGFTENANVKYTLARGAFRPPLVRPDCETNHGTHVAGIIGAKQGAAPGIDGIVPDADLEAVAIAAEFIGERDKLDADLSWQAQAMLFSDVLSNTMVYLTSNLKQASNLRVLNVSLAYNFVARGVLGDADPDEVEGLKLHIADQASVIRTMARLVENEVLFVVAAGNDSEGLSKPLEARWASPFAWAGTYAWTTGDPVRNIIVVEATGRDGKRAGFSNIGGHVSAPGVDIMSTLGSTTSPFGICSGTSQAAPHVTALAGLLFELAPEKTPAEIITALKDSGVPAAEGDTRAPRIDAIAAAAQVSTAARKRLADLDGNGTVDADDVRMFVRGLAAIETAAATEAAFTDDLNGDGVIDDNECYFPRIDLDGDGEASVREAKAARVPFVRSDLAPIETSWSGAAEALKAIFAETGLSARIAHSLVAANAETGASPPAKCRRKDGALIAALETAPGSSAPPAAAPSPPGSGGTATVAAGGPVSEAGPVVDAASSDVRAEVSKGVEDLKKSNPELKVVINPSTGLPSSISGFKPDAGSLAAGARPADQTEDDTRRIVETFLQTSGITAALPAKGKSAELKYTGRRADPDFPGRYIANVEQRVDGVKVFGSSARLTVENTLGVTKYQGTTSAAQIDKTVPDVTESAATASARKRLAELLKGSGTGAAPPLAMGPNAETAPATAEIVVFDPALLRAKVAGGARLAWLVSIDSFRLFVDAKTGEVFHFYRDKPTGLVRRIYDFSNPSDTAAIIDEDGKPKTQSVPDDAEQAFRYSGAVRDFFYLVFGRNSYDDNDNDGPKGGAPLESFIRFGNVRNAYWCPSKSYYCPKQNVMVFGPGYAGAVDIVAHEMVHAIIQYEANLVYSDEPGAVNESIADIFGALIEFYAKSGKANWLLGEDAPGYTPDRPLRSLANPNLTTPDGSSLFDRSQPFSSSNRGQPDHYGDLVSPADQICATTWLNDNGCVHFNSGILNKFAYLIAEGGVHRGTTVAPLGRQKLAHLTYRTLTANLNQTATLVEAAEGFLQSCLDLTQKKGSGFTEKDCDQVLAAQQAVGLVYGSS
ncbi:MAG: M4 family metallopeptidase [Hyphomicrobium sp.]|nr:M4 family metallopeptidase [Hyphomicrobium sp.]